MAYGAADTAGTALPVAAYPASSPKMREAESTASGMVPLVGSTVAPAGPTPIGPTASAPPAWPTHPAPWPSTGPTATAGPLPQERRDAPATDRARRDEPNGYTAGAAPWPSTGAERNDARGRTQVGPNGVVVSVSRQPGGRGRGGREAGATVTHIAQAASAAERSVQPTAPAPRLWGARRGARVESHIAPVYAPEHGYATPQFESTPNAAPEPAQHAAAAPQSPQPAAPAEPYGSLPLWGAPASSVAPTAAEPAPDRVAPDRVAPDRVDGAPGAGPMREPATAAPPVGTVGGVQPQSAGGFARLTRATGATEPFAITKDRVVLAAAIALVVLAAFGIASGVLTTALSTVSPTAYLTATWMLDFLVAVVALIASFLGVVGFLRTERTNLIAFGAGAAGAFIAVLQVTALILSMVQTAIFH